MSNQEKPSRKATPPSREGGTGESNQPMESTKHYGAGSESDAISEHLKRAFGQTASEPVPDEMVHLLRQLAKEKQQ